MNQPLSSSPVIKPIPRWGRNVAIVGIVLALHGAVLWALLRGLGSQAVEIIIPVEMLAQTVELPQPKVKPSARPISVKQHAVKTKAPIVPAVQPSPRPLAIADSTPTPVAPTGATTTQPAVAAIAESSAVAPNAAPSTPAAATQAATPAAPPAPTRIVLPSSDADYLNNPAPIYPAMSKRLGEQGKVLLRVFIGIDGLPEKAELKRSSGYERLDKSALDYILKCRFVAGKVNGVVQPMWYEAPVNYLLE